MYTAVACFVGSDFLAQCTSKEMVSSVAGSQPREEAVPLLALAETLVGTKPRPVTMDSQMSMWWLLR